MSETITKFETRLYMPTTFVRLRERVKAYYEDDRKEGKLFIQNGWSDSYDNMSDRDIGLERYSTDTRWSAYKAGRLDRESAVELAYKRRLKEIEKLEQAELAHVESVEKAGELIQAYITVEWRRSKTWGMNPIASMKCTYLDENMNQLDDTRVGELASGCGYDKHSTALASVFNRCPHILKPLYQKVEDVIAENPDARIKEILGYGTGYRETPYFEGGVGVNCHRRIFESLGYDWHNVSSTSTVDVHVINARKKVP